MVLPPPWVPVRVAGQALAQGVLAMFEAAATSFGFRGS